MVAANGFNVTFPANSITLLVIPAAGNPQPTPTSTPIGNAPAPTATPIPGEVVNSHVFLPLVKR